MTLAVHRLPALRDNYVWLLVDEAAREAAVVDPAEAAPVERALDRLGARLTAVLNTHHHPDHVGGNEELVRRFPGTRVYGSAHDAATGRIPAQTDELAGGQSFELMGHRVEVDDLPGHTLGHVAYRIEGRLFLGDVLFGGGCGRLFEGTPAQMQAALARVRALPGDTQVYCAHEYTLSNLRFAREVEPGNARLAERHARVAAAPEVPTVPLRLGEEKETNPFLRWDSEEIMAAVGEREPALVFAAVRRWKDGWRG